MPWRVEGNVEESERSKLEKDEVIAQHNDFDHHLKWSCEKHCDTDLSLSYRWLQIIKEEEQLEACVYMWLYPTCGWWF